MSNLTVFEPQPFQITVKASKRRRTFAMRVTDTGDVLVFTPQRIAQKTVIKLIKDHESWLFEQLAKAPKLSLSFKAGDTLFYMGERRQLRFEISSKKSVQLVASDILVKNTENALISEKTVQAQIEKWYISTARDIIEDRVYFYAKLIGKTVNTVRMKNTQTRWGSCSSKQNININWRLIMAPFEVMDYVILHEVCHLKHLNHSLSFWKLVKQIMPNYADKTNWLKKNADTLFWP